MYRFVAFILCALIVVVGLFVTVVLFQELQARKEQEAVKNPNHHAERLAKDYDCPIPQERDGLVDPFCLEEK